MRINRGLTVDNAHINLTYKCLLALAHALHKSLHIPFPSPGWSFYLLSTILVSFFNKVFYTMDSSCFTNEVAQHFG